MKLVENNNILYSITYDLVYVNKVTFQIFMETFTQKSKKKFLTLTNKFYLLHSFLNILFNILHNTNRKKNPFHSIKSENKQNYKEKLTSRFSFRHPSILSYYYVHLR